MKNIVVLVGSYYPDFSAVGACCFNIAEELVKGHKVTVICIKSRFNQSIMELYNGQKIIRISHKWWERRLKVSEKIKKNQGILKKWYELLWNGIRIRDYLQIVFSGTSIKKDLVEEYLKVLNSIKEPIDVIMPFCFPMEAIIAGVKYKMRVPEIKLIPYVFDQFVENKGLHKLEFLKLIKMQNHLQLEYDMIRFSDKLMVVHSQKRHFEKYFPKHYKEIEFVEHPLLKEVKYERLEETYLANADVYNLVFTGSLLKRYVMPNYMLDLLLKAKEKVNFTLQLYSRGNCNAIIEKYRRLMHANVINHGFVEKEIALRAIIESDILINIAEVKGVQISSKVFEYMSAGKPIVHFYSAEDDINMKILQRYPLKLCLKQDTNLLEINTEKFINFIQENKGKTLDFEEVSKIYYYATPKFILEQMLKNTNDKCGEVINK